MTNIDVQSGIEYGRGTVKTILNRDVIVEDMDAAARASAYLESDLGYQLLNWTTKGGKLILHFVRTTLIADTDRGDAVALDGRWKVKEM